jgi:hypothetical protein
MLDLGSTSCIISPQYPKVLKIPWVWRKSAIKANDFGENKVSLPGMYVCHPFWSRIWQQLNIWPFRSCSDWS